MLTDQLATSSPSFQHTRRLSRSVLEWIAVALILLFALTLRILLIRSPWPVTNSDEANMGLVALHVAFQGDHPIFFYGLPYMGPVEGYVAAALFRLFGPSLFTLRLALLPFVAGFLLSSYGLVRLLYGRAFAFACLLLFTFGSGDVLFLQLRAVGEYPEMLMFAPLILLLASWLACSFHPGSTQSRSPAWGRVALYFLLGISIGLALWIDFLIGPFVLAALALLVLFCGRELWGRAGLSLLLGMMIGAEPLLYYNLTAPSSQNSWATLLFIRNNAANTLAAHHLNWLHQLSGAFFIALPWATGYQPRCPLTAIPPWGLPTSQTWLCVSAQMGWGIAYVVLALLAAIFCLRRLHRIQYVPLPWLSHHSPHSHPASVGRKSPEVREARQEAIRQCTQLALLASVGLTLCLYAIAPVAAVSPETTFRYLTCALVALPVLLWPLWQRSTQALEHICQTRGQLRPANTGARDHGARMVTALPSTLLLLLVALTFVVGTARTFAAISASQADYQRRLALIHDLETIGATRVYSEYWTCNWLVFLSQERIICSVLDAELRPGFNRYGPYRQIVERAPSPAYVFPVANGLLDATTGRQQASFFQRHVLSSPGSRQTYRLYQFVGYLVYQPRPSSPSSPAPPSPARGIGP
ncbi:MAG: hypothetical protein IRZ31_10195 [Thermogemmatispora sp.]|uniref:ArnT family glycosyltransferase n=1 Tax=Thermogemmatispora sp. TaxID=1968838 RepID=UPI0026098A6C|nr:hypothetical protein [Thermogemmatispora sp.]MBX5457262.1 hypothetical protein [Thermogemmatispora sp.]